MRLSVAKRDFRDFLRAVSIHCISVQFVVEPGEVQSIFVFCWCCAGVFR